MDITKKWLQTCGDHSLEGALYEAGVRHPQPLTLRFEQGVLDPEQGPDLLLVPDFVPVCLLRSVVSLCRQGYELKIETYLAERSSS